MGKIILITIIIIFSSCTKIVNIDIPQVEQKTTLYSLVGTSRQLQVSIGKSYGILEYIDPDNVPENESAEINLFVNESFIETLSKNGSYYYSLSYLPNTGDTVEIIARTNSNDTLVARTYIPATILLASAVLTDSAFFDKDGYLQSQVTINFNDLPNTKNYYEVYFRAQCDETNPNNYIPVTNYNSASPIIANEDILDYEPQSILFSDELFDGEETKIPISFSYPCIDEYTGSNIETEFKVVVYFLSVTEEYYLYRKTLYKHLFSQQTNIWDGAIEPINMYSNVKGGYGVFAGYSLSKHSLYSN
ncbi:MAG: DUF4249 domain-containing protein [Bacteroidales bacterium]|nr:DUF4249 domain-containing protein [Bacteroidales bacterium]